VCVSSIYPPVSQLHQSNQAQHPIPFNSITQPGYPDTHTYRLLVFKEQSISRGLNLRAMQESRALYGAEKSGQPLYRKIFKLF
jgi:hypothetical protein